MDNKYNFNSTWRAFSTTSNETLTLSTYQGTVSITMFKKGTESRKPPVKKNLSLAELLVIGNLLKELLKAQPNTRMPFTQMNFNKETRTYEAGTSFVFVKDDHRTYSIEISSKYIPTPVKFAIRCSSTFTTTGEALGDEQKSHYGMLELIEIFTHILPEQINLSKFNIEPRQNGGNRGGNNNHQHNNNNNGNNRDPYGQNPDEEVLF